MPNPPTLSTIEARLAAIREILGRAAANFDDDVIGLAEYHDAYLDQVMPLNALCDELVDEVKRLEDESRQWEKASLVKLLAERDALRARLRELKGGEASGTGRVF